jgi:hypothetical protein
MDTVEIRWKIRDASGALLHASASTPDISSARTANENTDLISTEELEEEPFSFQVGIEPRQVIVGWEHLVRTMYEGEKVEAIIAPHLAFGSKGVPGIIPPDTTIHCEFELLRIIPALSKRYNTVGINENINEELAAQIEAGETPIARQVMHTESRSASQRPYSSPTSEASTDRTKRATEPSPGSAISDKEDGTSPRFFDPAKHKVDANLRIDGTGNGYSWSERKDNIDIEIPLCSAYESGIRIAKQDVEVTLR